MSRRLRLRTVVAVVVAAVVALGPSALTAQAASVPYTDLNASGFIALCTRDGHAMTSGKITDRPFAWRAISSVAAPAGYGVQGAKATLMVFQPRPHTYPDAWSGDTMTSASPYTTVAHPTAAASVLDFSLADFIHEFPPMLDGVLELRMFFGAPGKPTWSSSYPATDIQVTGTTWRVVRGGTLACSSGAAQVNEPGKADPQGNAVVISHPKPVSTTSPAARTTAPAAASSRPAPRVVSASGSTSVVPVANDPVSASSPVGSTSSWLPVAGVSVLVLAGAAGAGWFAYRRRTAAPVGRHS